MNNPQQPGKYDAVLGGNSPSLDSAAVLGGIEGVKLRLKNSDAQVRIAAIKEAFNYGEQGLDLLIQVVKDKSLEISTDYEYKQKVKETSSYWYKTWNIDWDFYNKLPEEEEREREEFWKAEYKAWEAEERRWEEEQRQWEEEDRQLEAQIKQWEKEEIQWEEQEIQWEEQEIQWEEQERRWKEKWNMDDEYKYNI